MGVLDDMKENAPTEIEQVQASIDGMIDQIADLQTKIDGLWVDLLHPHAASMQSLLEAQKPANYTSGSTSYTYNLDYGPDFNANRIDGNIRDWSITETSDDGIITDTSTIFTWANATEEMKTLATDWDFGIDYVWKPVGLEGTYGLEDMIAKLNDGKSLMNKNKSKLTSLLNVG